MTGSGLVFLTYGQMRLVNMRYLMILLAFKLAIWASVVSPGLTLTAVISGHFGTSRCEISANKFLSKCVSVVSLQVVDLF